MTAVELAEMADPAMAVDSQAMQQVEDAHKVGAHRVKLAVYAALYRAHPATSVTGRTVTDG